MADFFHYHFKISFVFTLTCGIQSKFCLILKKDTPCFAFKYRQMDKNQNLDEEPGLLSQDLTCIDSHICIRDTNVRP